MSGSEVWQVCSINHYGWRTLLREFASKKAAHNWISEQRKIPWEERVAWGCLEVSKKEA